MPWLSLVPIPAVVAGLRRSHGSIEIATGEELLLRSARNGTVPIKTPS